MQEVAHGGDHPRLDFGARTHAIHLNKSEAAVQNAVVDCPMAVHVCAPVTVPVSHMVRLANKVEQVSVVAVPDEHQRRVLSDRLRALEVLK